MGKKGFTLIELLAVIVILGIISLIVVPVLTNSYNDSKKKSEDIFLERLSSVIGSYISLNSDTINFDSTFTARKKNSDTGVDVYQGKITINDLIDSKLLSLEDFVNPGNKESNCNVNTEIEVFRDSDFVYCHKMKRMDCLSAAYDANTYVINTCEWESELS